MGTCRVGACFVYYQMTNGCAIYPTKHIKYKSYAINFLMVMILLRNSTKILSRVILTDETKESTRTDTQTEQAKYKHQAFLYKALRG